MLPPVEEASCSAHAGSGKPASPLDWGEVFNDPVLATAVIHCRLHYSTTLNVKGESYLKYQTT
jgi:hypothetical protein